MKTFFGIALALITVLFIRLSVAQTMHKQTLNDQQVKNWQYHDSMASARLFSRDTISAIEQYQLSLKLNPDNNNAKKNLEKLTYYYMKAGQSFYNIDP